MQEERGLEVNNTYTLPLQTIPVTSERKINVVGSEYEQLVMKNKSGILSVSEKAVLDAIAKVNKALEGAPQKFEYRMHKDTGELMIRVINKDTNLVIREIPPEKLVDLIEKLKGLKIGTLLDEKR